MLKYFLSKTEIPQIQSILEQLNQKKQRLQTNDFSEAYREYGLCKENFKEILAIAKVQKDELLANAQYVFGEYFLLFCNLSDYFDMLMREEFKASWSKLQDCLDLLIDIGRFVNVGERFDVPKILSCLEGYEQLYPYRVFASSEFIVSKSHCSICGKSTQSLSCFHRRGQLYWGERAIEIIDQIEAFQGVAIVSHPEDKRCIIELADDIHAEGEKYKKLIGFVKLNLPFLAKFTIYSQIETRLSEDMPKVGGNRPCPCGSGKKFKHCCKSSYSYEHQRNIVTSYEPIQLISF